MSKEWVVMTEVTVFLKNGDRAVFVFHDFKYFTLPLSVKGEVDTGTVEYQPGGVAVVTQKPRIYGTNTVYFPNTEFASVKVRTFDKEIEVP